MQVLGHFTVEFIFYASEGQITVRPDQACCCKECCSCLGVVLSAAAAGCTCSTNREGWPHSRACSVAAAAARVTCSKTSKAVVCEAVLECPRQNAFSGVLFKPNVHSLHESVTYAGCPGISSAAARVYSYQQGQLRADVHHWTYRLLLRRCCLLSILACQAIANPTPDQLCSQAYLKRGVFCLLRGARSREDTKLNSSAESNAATSSDSTRRGAEAGRVGLPLVKL